MFLASFILLYNTDDAEDAGLIILASFAGLTILLAIAMPFLYPRLVTNPKIVRIKISETEGILHVENETLSAKRINVSL